MLAFRDHAGRRAWLLFALLGSLLLFPACHRRRRATPPSIKWDATPIDWHRPLPETPPGGLAEAGYVGAAACRLCHGKIYASYARHSMARTGLRPLASLDQAWLARIFDAGAAHPLRHPKSGVTYRPFRRGDRYFIEAVEHGASGAPARSWVQPITYALSAGTYGLAFYFRQGSRIHHAPLDYYARLGRFDFDPIAFGGDPRFSTSLGTYCISCHSDYPRRRAGTREIFYDPFAPGIGCERCHGPGAKHVDSMDPKDIVNPARLSPVLQLDLCAQCHESSSPVARAGRHDFDYRPGQPLGAFRIDFVAAKAEPDRFDLLAHADRLVRSACFRGARGRLTCTSCHDPHSSSLDEPASYWDDKCLACHRDRPCTAPKELRAQESNHCPRCHMRAGRTANVPLVSVTDHFIQRRPPPVRPGPIERPTQLAAWPELAGEKLSGDDLPAARALALARIGRPEAALALVSGPSRPRLPALYQWLAEHFFGRRQVADAEGAWAALLRLEPDSAVGLIGYARASLARGGASAVREASAALDRLLALDPENVEARDLRRQLPPPAENSNLKQ